METTKSTKSIELTEELSDDNIDFGKKVYCFINRDGGDFRSAYYRVYQDEIYQNRLRQFEKINFTMSWPTINKLIEQNNECPISLEVIKKGDEYCICAQCLYNFLKEEIKTHFKNQFQNNRDMTCPMCKTKWLDQTIYINEANQEKK